MNPVKALKDFFKNYGNFGGRVRRRDFWWTLLYVIAVGLLLVAVDFTGIPLSWLWWLAVLVPTLSLTVRRLHDSGKSGLFALLLLVPILNLILFIVWGAWETGPANRWGPTSRPIFPGMFGGYPPPVDPFTRPHWDQ